MSERKKFLGATDIVALLGLSPYKSPLQLALEKKGRWKPEVTAAMTRGLDLERYVAAIASERLGPLTKAPFVVHPEHEFLAASPDYMGDAVLVEIKTHHENHRFKPHPIAADAIQVGWQRHLMRRAQILDPQAQYVVIAWVSRHARIIRVGDTQWPVGIVDVDFDGVDPMDDAMKEVEGVAIQWWHRYVLGDELPPADYRDTAVLQALYEPDKSELPRDAEVDALIEDLYGTYQRYQRIKREYETAQNRIRQKLGAHTWTDTHRGVVRWTPVSRTETKVDLEKLQEKYPDAYAECVQQHTAKTRRLTLPPWALEEDE